MRWMNDASLSICPKIITLKFFYFTWRQRLRQFLKRRVSFSAHKKQWTLTVLLHVTSITDRRRKLSKLWSAFSCNFLRYPCNSDSSCPKFIPHNYLSNIWKVCSSLCTLWRCTRLNSILNVKLKVKPETRGIFLIWISKWILLKRVLQFKVIFFLCSTGWQWANVKLLLVTFAYISYLSFTT
jgi:hypothetical protein